MYNILGGVVSSAAQGLGYTPLLAALIEGMILVNLHIFLPGIEKVDKYITKKVYNSEEALLKSEQDWYFINKKANEVFDYLSISNKYLQGNLKEEPQLEEPQINTHAPGDVPHLHYDPKTGVARDISKVGVPGSQAKFESDTPKETPTSVGKQLSDIIKKLETTELPKLSEESKRIMQRLE